MVLTIGSAVLFAGCTCHGTGNALHQDYGQDWLSHMSSQLGGDHGAVAGSCSSMTRTRSTPAQESHCRPKLAGLYDVLAICQSTSMVHLAIHDIATKHDRYGDSIDTTSLIGEANIDCGEMTRIPIDVPEGRDGITLDATTTDTSE